MIFLGLVFVAMEYPNSLGGWIAVVSGIALVASIIGGAIVAGVTRWIESKVDRSVHVEVPSVVAFALREVNAKLDGIRINQAELSAEMGRVRILETKIDNGLTSTVAIIEERQSELVVQVAEIHGWMKAARKWNGDDRRNG
jgi:hypothetical protein